MSKKSIIAIITIIVLLLAAGISVGIFLYGRGEIEAVEGNLVTDGTQASENVQNSENNNDPTTNPDAGDENTVTSGDGNVDGADDNEIINNETTGNNSVDNENEENTTITTDTKVNNVGETTITTDTNVNNVEETTITRVEEKEKIVSKTFFDWWKPMDVKVTKSKLGLKNGPQITVEKSVETNTGVEELVYSGQNVTYVIKVTNNGETSVEDIEITDKIPQGTTYVSIEDAKIEGGENFSGKTVLTENIVDGVKWTITIPSGKTVEARFTVQVVATEGTIYNTAIANGKESNDGEDTKTSIITSSKTSEITRNNQLVEIAKVDDLITYTITVKNTGEIAGSTTIKDTIPIGTEFVSTPEGEDAQVSTDKKLLTWNITVPAGGEVKKQFTVKVKEVNGTIKNTATVGNTDTETDITETAGITVKKDVVDIKRNNQSIGKTAKVKENDVIEYKITVTNNGSKDLTDVVVDEKLPNIVLNASELNIGALEAGASKEINATYTVKYDTDIYKNEARLVNNEVEVTGKTTNPEEEVKDDDKTETEIEKVSLIDVEKKATAVLEKTENGFVRKEITENMPVKPTVRPGDVIEYVITVENTGNTVLENVKVTDLLAVSVGSETATENNAGSIIYEADKLEPSDTLVEIKVYYTVKETDANVTVQTFINNEVKVTATDPDVPETPVEDTDKDDTVEVNPNVDISVSKVWPTVNEHNIKPNSITVKLFKLVNNQEVEVEGKQITLDDKNNWANTFENLPKYDENKNTITYTVKEVPVGGYESTTAGNMTEGYTITNTDKITQTKTSVIKRLNPTTGQYDTVTTARVGDIIEYTITVYNASNTAATVTITDELPVTSVKLLTTDLNVNGSTITWEKQVVPANSNLSITFEVEVTSVDLGAIKNIAKVGNSETNPDEVKVEAYIIFEENGGESVPDMTGIAGEAITDTTMPTTTRTGYVFDGWYSDSRLFHNDKVKVLPNVYPAGTTIYYAKWIPKTDTEYTVIHHLQDAVDTDTYIPQVPVDTLKGTTGALTEALARTYTGYEAQPFNQKIISADGSTVVDIYYDIVINEGLHVTKTRTAIVDISGNGNTSYVDQEGDIIKYTITVTNIAAQKAEGIQVIDNLPVTVTSIKIAGEPQNIQNTVFDRDRNLLEGIQNVSLEPNKSIEITVEYTVNAQELIHALKTDHKKLLNTATAVLNGKLYTGTDGEGTDVHGEPVINISKSGSTHVNVGGTIEYLITVENTGYIGTTVTVTDELIDTTYVPNSAKIEDSNVEPVISENSNGNKVLTWIFDIEPRATERITFEATAPNNAFGEDIENTANSEHTVNTGKVEDTSNEVITKVNEVHVVHDEYLEGQLGTDLNIIFVLDNSSSMNYPIAGQSYTKNSSYYPIAPTDVPKTRLYNAKEAIKSFIDEHSQNQNTSMSVITFNSTNTGTDPDYMTLMDIEDDDIIEKIEKGWVWDEEDGRIYTDVTKYYFEIDGTEYPMTDNKIQGSDGLWYYGVYIPIEHGARCIGSNTTLTNKGLKEAVDNISISSEKSGFGTYIYPAFNEINNNTSKYLSNSKKNIVIVLADGAFSGNYYNQLQQLENNVDEIYCIGFGSGSEYNATALANMSTNGVCYEASDASTLLDAFEQIEESASKQGYGTTLKGEITISEASDEIIVSDTTPIVVTYATGHVDENGHHIMATLFECKSEADLAKYGITLSSDKKVITWDAKEFIEKNPGVIVPSTVYLKYYIQRSSSN